MSLADNLNRYAARAADKRAAEADLNEIRAEVEAEMRSLHAMTGTLPSAKVAGCAARLQGGEPRVTISDLDAYAAWVAEHPEFAEAVTFVIRVPRKRVDSDEFQALWARLQLLAESTSSEVRDYVLDTLIADGTADVERGKLVLDGGEVVDGVQVWKTEPGLWIVPTKPKG